MKISFYQLIIFISIFTVLFSKPQEIVNITFSGNENISTEELADWLPIKESSIFDKSIYNSRSLKLAVIQLKHLYSSNGFINAKINPKVGINKKQVHIEFKIEEGNQFHIKKIEFFGNRIFTNDEIIKILNVKVDDVFNPIHITKQLKVLIRKYLESGKFYISIMTIMLYCFMKHWHMLINFLYSAAWT